MLSKYDHEHVVDMKVRWIPMEWPLNHGVHDTLYHELAQGSPQVEFLTLDWAQSFC